MSSTYSPVDPADFDWLGHDPIPASVYSDPDWFALEREAIFKRTWQHVGHICELPEPGCFIVREVPIAKASILITRGKDGQIHAQHNVCTHRGTELVDVPSGKRATFTCPYHAWTFAPDGKLLSAPDFEQFHVSKADCSLKRVSVETCGGMIFINLDPELAQDLLEFLGPIADQLDTMTVARATEFTEYVFEIDANWKIYVDNFQENYHLRFIHPRTGAAALGEENPFGYPVNYAFYGPHRTQTLWKNPNVSAPSAVQGKAFGGAIQRALAENGDQPVQAKVDFKLFPCMFIIGQAAYFFTHTVMPVSHDKTRGSIRIYWVGEDDSASKRFEREYIAAMLRDIHSEDRGIVMAGQRGLSGGALEHVHFQTHEILCRHLAVTVQKMVEAYQAEPKAS